MRRVTIGTEVVSRRHFLWASSAAMAAPAIGCASTDSPITSNDPLIGRTDRERRAPSAPAFTRTLRPRPVTADLGGPIVETWAFEEILGGPVLRMQVGAPVSIAVQNDLPESTTIHWHGLALRNDMDGVMDLTQREIESGEAFEYRFTPPDPGTYWFHPHMGLQLDRGLYAPLIVEDPADPIDADVDHVVVLDDWLDGIGGRTPEAAFSELSSMADMGDMDGMDMGRMGMGNGQVSDLVGGDAGDVDYDHFLINGRAPADRPTFVVPERGKIRLRLINAASDTAFRVQIGGQQMTVTHADGFPVEHVAVDSVLIGMGERYDIALTPESGAWPIYAEAIGKGGHAAAVLRTDGSVAAAPPSELPRNVTGRLLTYGDLVAEREVRSLLRDPRVIELRLQGSMMANDWTIGGRRFGDHEPIEVAMNEHIRLRITNDTSMWHPMHLHGHTFRLGARSNGPRKDTANVLPGKGIDLDVVCDNPGQWMLHCHNTYHLEAGMATVLSYVR